MYDIFLDKNQEIEKIPGIFTNVLPFSTILLNE